MQLARTSWGHRVGAGLLATALLVSASGTGDEAEARWTAWETDLGTLLDQIEQPASLREILEAKGVDWPAVRKQAEKRFKEAAAGARKRRSDDARSDEVAFYDLLRFVVGQLRDTHATVQVADDIAAAWKESRPPTVDAGIELQLGTHDTVLVSNTFAARKSTSPLYGRGVRHEATLLESVNGKPTLAWLHTNARQRYEDEGWLSTPGRALSEALNGLSMPADGELELVFRTLDVSERERSRYLDTAPAKRARAFARLKWKEKKVTLRAAECVQTRNPRNFRFMGLPALELRETSDPDVRHAVLASGMGYIAWWGVSGKSRAGLEEACAALDDCPGLIIDLRLNGGGGESAVAALDSQDGVWSRPIAVLTGPRTMSAAETELWSLLQMRERGRCTVRTFGETTAGASGDKIQFELPSGFATGRFVYRHWHGGRSQIEGVGLVPDEPILQDLIELSLGIDSCLRAAEDWLRDA
jgi:C-terminal processing protease CtpA/Prc